MGWYGGFVVGNSPSTNVEVSLVANPWLLKWLRKRGKVADLSVLGMLVIWFGCVVVGGILARMGKILVDFQCPVVVVG